jgi:hypothetical protein
MPQRKKRKYCKGVKGGLSARCDGKWLRNEHLYHLIHQLFPLFPSPLSCSRCCALILTSPCLAFIMSFSANNASARKEENYNIYRLHIGRSFHFHHHYRSPTTVLALIFAKCLTYESQIAISFEQCWRYELIINFHLSPLFIFSY